MGPSEIVWRVRAAARLALWRSRRTWLAPVPVIRSTGTPWNPLDLLTTEEREALIAEADRYVSGDYTMLNVAYHERPIDWHRDPGSGRVAPRKFAASIPYRDPGEVGNVKNIWEKSRHHHLTVLALAYAATGAGKYAAEVERQLADWTRANPILWGVNWVSALELGIRLIAWTWIEHLLRGSPEHQRLFGSTGTMWDSVYWHQRVLGASFSRGSSANNHVIGEAAGLFIAAAAWPFFAESQAWNRKAADILVTEARRQTFADGLNREQAFGYHVFVLEFLALAAAAGESAGALHRSLSPTLQAMVDPLSTLADGGGNPPRYGDDDDGMAVQLRPRSLSHLSWVIRLCETLGYRVPRPSGSRGYTDAGVFVLRTGHGASELYCVADAGPLGYLSIAAHGHADALSFEFSVGGRPVIVDPGTYAYHVEPRWRGYFRGTAAHNTVVVDDRDQAEPAGMFMWRSHPPVRVLTWQAEPEPVLQAEHGGYRQLPGMPVHRRTFRLGQATLDVSDDILGAGEHNLEWRLHMHPTLELMPAGNGYAVVLRSDQTVVCELEIDRRMSWEVLSGAANGGWYSAGYNLLEPTQTLSGRIRTALPFVTSFRISAR